MPMCPRGSMSQSGQLLGSTWLCHTSQRRNMSNSSDQWSKKSPVMRHIFACFLKCHTSAITAGSGGNA